MKGADTVMSSIVQYNDWLEEEVMALGRGWLRGIFFQSAVNSTPIFTPCIDKMLDSARGKIFLELA